MSGGYGLQSQLVPRGTESPSATMDDVRGAADVLVEDDVFDSGDDVEQEVAIQVRAIRPMTAQPSRRLPISRVIVTKPSSPDTDVRSESRTPSPTLLPRCDANAARVLPRLIGVAPGENERPAFADLS